MGITYSIDASKNLMISNWSGVIEGAEFVDVYTDAMSDPKFFGDTNELADISKSTEINVTANDMKRLIAARRRRFKNQICMTAVIAPRDHQFGVTRMFGSYSEIAKTETVMPFRTRREALDWLAHEETPETAR